MEINDTPLFIGGVDVSRYRAAERKIRHVFNRASPELVAMVVNFAHSRDLGVPSSHSRGWERRKAALDKLLDGGYVGLLYGHWHDTTGGGKGRCSIYRRTALFEQTFRFGLPARLAVTPASLTTIDTITTYEQSPQCHNRMKVNSIPALSTYARMIEGVELTLSNGGQVFGKVTNLYRKDGRRIYAPGVYNYQSGIKKAERRHLLINGEPTVELDYSAMHASIILNSIGEPCRGDFYESILGELGVPPTGENRGALKHLVNATFNAGKTNYGAGLGNSKDKDSGKRLIDILDVKPKQVRAAILTVYPMLAPYVCTGDHSDWLQTTDSEIMIDVLETLAKLDIAGLPLHDSVIAPAKYADIVKPVMSACYKKKMGFAPYVK